MRARPKILLVALETEWLSAARLPRALQAAGFEVGIACREKAFTARTRYRDHLFLLPEKKFGQGLLAGIKTIVSAWPPDLILPLDDRTALFLTAVYEQLTAVGDKSGLVILLRRSLGNPASTKEALSKRSTVQVARQLGLRVPAGRTVESVEEAVEFGLVHEFQVVLKRSFDSGGNGVFVCRSEADIRKHYQHLMDANKTTRRLKVWREQLRGRIMGPSWLPDDQSITVSQFVAGKNATSLAASVEGEMLAVLTALVEQTYPDAAGPSSVVKMVYNEEISQATRRMLKHWGLTGLIGFDFIVNAAGKAWLLECNPRPTALAHLGAQVGEDVCTALYLGLLSAPAPRKGMARELMVAHFPYEIWRAPQSAYLKTAFHDVPLDDPALLEAIQKHPPFRRHRV